jgi:peptide-methionine (S)-S-oxide reductase
VETTESTRVFLCEHKHQQYLAKNPDGYCGLGGCNIRYFSPAEKA